MNGAIQKSIELAFEARTRGDHPFGAVLLSADGQIILEALNSVNTDGGDVTKHAELNLISAATRKYKREELQDMILVSSTEPCGMCASAMFWAGIHKVAFACSHSALFELAGPPDLAIGCEKLLSEFTVLPEDQLANFEITGPFPDALGPHEGFWKE